MCYTSRWVFVYRQMALNGGTHAVFPDVLDPA